MGRKRTPAEEYIWNQIRELERTALMEKKLREYGRPVQGGYMMTWGDMQRFFADLDKKKKRKKKFDTL